MSRNKVVRGASWENYCNMMIANGIRSAVKEWGGENGRDDITSFRIIAEEQNEQESKRESKEYKNGER